MSVTVLLVLGERANELIDELSMEHWFSSYIGTIQLPLHMCTMCLLASKARPPSHTMHTIFLILCLFLYISIRQSHAIIYNLEIHAHSFAPVSQSQHPMAEQLFHTSFVLHLLEPCNQNT